MTRSFRSFDVEVKVDTIGVDRIAAYLLRQYGLQLVAA